MTSVPYHIARVIAVSSMESIEVEDLPALRANVIPLSKRFKPGDASPGFLPPEPVSGVLSIGLLLAGSETGAVDGGVVAWGDCVFPDASDGTPTEFDVQNALLIMRDVLAPALEGHPVTNFHALAALAGSVLDSAAGPSGVKEAPSAPPARRRLFEASLRALHRALVSPSDEKDSPRPDSLSAEQRFDAALRYGVTQALLGAVAFAQGATMAEVLAADANVPAPSLPVPVCVRVNGDWQDAAGQMIELRLPSLPYLYVTDVNKEVGKNGEKLVRAVSRLSEQLQALDDPVYTPTIHVDVQGALGNICDRQLGRVLGKLYGMAQAAKPYPVRVENPVIMDSRDEQIDALKTLIKYVQFRKIPVEIVADVWVHNPADVQAFIEAGAADMIRVKLSDVGGIHRAADAVRLCQARDIPVLLAGGFEDSDVSARTVLHAALALQPDLVMTRSKSNPAEAVREAQGVMARLLEFSDAQKGGSG